MKSTTKLRKEMLAANVALSISRSEGVFNGSADTYKAYVKAEIDNAKSTLAYYERIENGLED